MFISKIRIPCTIVAFFSTPITDAAEVLVKRCITSDEKTMEITYDYELLEHYSTENHKTANAQNSAQTATNAQTSGSVATNAQTSGYVAQTSGSTATNSTTQTVATSSFITPAATNPLAVSVSTPTPQTTCPSWLSHMDQRKHEKKDDIPNHPLVLMVNMQIPHNIVSLVSLGPCYISCLL